MISCHKKAIETRSWATTYRGKIAIHAASSYNHYVKEACNEPQIQYHLPSDVLQGIITKNPLYFGRILAIATLSDCILMTQDNINQLSKDELSFGWYEINRYMWLLKDIQPVISPPIKGKQGLWNIPKDFKI